MNSPFPIACCSIAMRHDPVLDAIKAISVAGFSGIEILYPHIEKLSDDELREVAKACAAAGLRVPVISPYFSFTRGEERATESLRTAEKVLAAARILGAKKVRTFVDCGLDGVSSKNATESHWAAAREGLKRLCALDPETHFVVETHEFTLADTLPSVRRLLDEVAMTNLRLNYQSNHDFLERGFYACLEELYPAVSHMHWEQIREDESGTYLEEKGRIDFAKLIALLREKKYTGTASVEYCWNPVEEGRIATGGKYLRELFKK